jgi:DNA-binding transcriptional MerR regulator
MDSRHYRIKELAELSGVTVRTLHHYDHIGLLVPSARTSTGYRMYTQADLLRLQQVLVHRELGLSLEAIRKLLDDPQFDHAAALREQRRLLSERAVHTAQMIRAVDQALALIEQQPQAEQAPGGMTMTTDMKALFDGFDPAAYEKEAEARWGHTDAYNASNKRVKGRTPEQWAQYRAEDAAIMHALSAALHAGAASHDPAVMDLAEQHRLLIDRWFYPCSKAMHANLADLYEADPRFAQNIDKHAAGLTPFLAAAIRENARRAKSY